MMRDSLSIVKGSSMSDITTFLTYNDRAEEAARFYTSIFPNSRITRVSHYPDIEGLPPAGSVMMVEFELMGRPFVALNGGPQFSFTQGISVSVQCDTQQEVDGCWATKAAKSPAAGDRQVRRSWQVNPKLLLAMVSAWPDKAKKAMQAMMGMVKIDSAGIARGSEFAYSNCV
jgi:predicted 3-demethylubiquinone-9 3-methyltransferase (glyoxalase superfamily)